MFPKIPCKTCIVRPACNEKYCTILEQNKIKRIIFFKFDLTIMLTLIDFLIVYCFLGFQEIFNVEELMRIFLIVPMLWLSSGFLISIVLKVIPRYFGLIVAAGPFMLPLSLIFPDICLEDH